MNEIRTLPGRMNDLEVTAHLIGEHAWADTTLPAKANHQAHDYLHGAGRADLADPTLNHTHTSQTAGWKIAGAISSMMALLLVVGLLALSLDAEALALKERGGTDSSEVTSTTWKSTPNLVDAPIGSLASYVESRDSGSLALNIDGYLFGLHEDDVRALLDYLGFNAGGVIDLMEHTRALDGMQTATGRYATVHWNYHPDHGMNMVFEAAVESGN